MPHKPKRDYPSQGAAIAACLRASRRTGIPMRPYFCGECKKWHMTKLPKG